MDQTTNKKPPTPKKPVDEIKVNPNEKMSFTEYKEIVTQDDIKKLEKNMKPFWWENFPVLGPMIYGFRTQLRVAEIDRGLLRKSILVMSWIYVAAFLYVFFGIFWILTPWFYYSILRNAIKRTHKKMANQNLN